MDKMEDQLRDMQDRLQRIESRVVRGFTEMGVRVVDEANWFKVDIGSRKVYLRSAGKSIAAIELALHAAGAPADTYDISIAGEHAFMFVLKGRKTTITTEKQT